MSDSVFLKQLSCEFEISGTWLERLIVIADRIERDEKMISPAKPTEPGWYWVKYKNGWTEPVYVEWTGFVNNPEARQLEITLATGEEYLQPLGNVEEFDGEFVCKLEVPE